MIANGDAAEQLRARPDINMATDPRHSVAAVSQRNLLEDQAIDADLAIRMDDDAVGMGNEQPAPDPARERDVRAGRDRPETMPGDRPLARHPPDRAATAVSLIAAVRREQR